MLTATKKDRPNILAVVYTNIFEISKNLETFFYIFRNAQSNTFFETHLKQKIIFGSIFTESKRKLVVQFLLKAYSLQ